VKRKIRVFTIEFIYLLAALILAAVLAFFVSTLVGIIVAGVGIVVIAVFILFSMLRRIKWQKIVLKTLRENNELNIYLNTMIIPTALTTLSGKVRWCNLAFRDIGGYGAKSSISKMIEGIDVPDKDMRVYIGDKAYKKEIYSVKHKRREMLLYRLIDVENTIKANELYQNYLGVVCYMQVDNYDELSAEISQTDLSSVIAKTEKKISQFAKELSGTFLRIGRGKYMCQLERRSLPALRAAKFPILTEVRQIKKTFCPTLSIAIGVGQTPVQSSDFAARALELALGRGGDQAVIKQGDKFEFFGGAIKTTHRRNKVKSRMISHALRNLMEQCSDVYVMGHEAPDLDCMGAALGICACARGAGKNAYIVVQDPNPSIEPLLERLSKSKEYAGNILTGQEAAINISASSLLVVVDTQNAGYTIWPNLLELSDTIVVFDHHLRGTSNIENTALYYHEPYASSVCELVTEVLQYFGDDLSPKPIELEALLCGIIIDTKDFLFNTGVRTFEAASYLRRNGADTRVIRELVQDDIALYETRTDIVRSAEVLGAGIAIAKCPTGTTNAQLVAAQAADDLLTIRGNKASFVVSESGTDAAISGRSIGEVNVQLILEELGGGGHATMAAAKLSDTSITQAYEQLKTAINKFMKED
jgi:cyclic-di-AMP phosphodiesterase